LRKPTRQEVEDKIRKIYPDAKVTYFAPKEFDPADPTVMVGEQIQAGKPGDGYLGPTMKIGGKPYGVPNPIRIAQDVADTKQSIYQKQVDTIRSQGGNASMPKWKPNNKENSTATKVLFPTLKREQRNSYQPKGEMIEANAGPSTPVKRDTDGRLVPNQGGGRPGNVRLKPHMLPRAGRRQPQYAHYEPEGEMIGEQGILGAIDKAARDTAGNLGSEYAKRQHGNLLGIPGAIGRARGQRTYDQLKDRVLGGGGNNRRNNIGGAGRIQNSYEPEGEVVSERSRLDGPEERKKDLDKRYDPKGGGTNPFQHVPVKKAQKEHVGESRKIKKKFGPKPKPGNPAEYLKNLPAPPTKNLPLPEQLTSEGKSDGDPCWDSHKQVGMKKKGGKMVPNCVPKEQVEESHKNPESVKGIAKELDKAVEMHKSQAKRLRKAGVSEGAAWTKKSGKNQSGGLNEKGRKSYERENPGSDLKAPSKKVGNKRRASFCARMKGMKKKLTSKKTANDPDSRINKSLRKWNC